MGEANRATLRTREHYSVFNYTKDGFEPPFIHAGNRTPPTSLPLLGRLRPSDFVYVKTEFSVFLRTLPTKELTDTFVSIVLLFFSSIIEFLLGTQGVNCQRAVWFPL